MDTRSHRDSRRRFLKRCLMGGCALAAGSYAATAGFKKRPSVPTPSKSTPSLWKWSKEADWYDHGGVPGENTVFCRLCPHGCALEEGKRGFCRTRMAQAGKLYTVAYGNPCAVHIDPIEKKPLNHFLPGSLILSIATAGCNLRCLYCQNWEISQARPEDTNNSDLFPEVLLHHTLEQRIPAIAYTYSEPVVFYEYVYDTARLAKAAGVRNVLVTAAYIEPRPLRKLCQVIDAANVDLKNFDNDFYRKVCRGTLKPVLEAIKIMRKEGVWVEITNLVVPTLSDSLEKIKRMCEWIVSELGADLPLHFSRFHPLYKLKALPPTPLEILLSAREIALQNGLHYVYIGNVPGSGYQNTICPSCKQNVIAREGYAVLYNLLKEGRCTCGASVAGVWS